MSSGSDYGLSMPKLLRPRAEFPTPLFKLALPLLLVLAVVLAVGLLR
jgi:hypothetical protein